MSNKNCLEGIACPQCEAEGPFVIRVSAMICIHDDGSDNEYGGLDWGDDSEIICRDCGHRGTVAEFRLTGNFREIANKLIGDLADFQREIAIHSRDGEWDTLQAQLDLLEEEIKKVRESLPKVRALPKEV